MPRSKEVQLSQKIDHVTVIITVSERAVSAYEQHGWTLVDDGSSETDPEDVTSGADDQQVEEVAETELTKEKEQ